MSDDDRKCLPCRRCQTDRHLRWKHYDFGEWWVACEGCGNHGPALASQASAGMAWNREQRVAA